MKFVISASVIAVMTATGGAYAADLIVDTPMMVEPSVATSGIKGTVEVGLLGTYADQNDDDFADWAYGAYLGANIWGTTDSLYWGIDGYLEGNSFSDTGDEAPNYVGTLGGHLGFGTSDLMLGGFVSGGMVPSYLDENEGGYTAGIEGMAKFDNFGIFGQLGYADIRTDGTDNGFTGGFVRGGALFGLSDDFAVMVDASYGHTDDFEDAGDEGEFWAAGVKGAWKLPTDFDAFLTAGYEYQHYEALSEPTSGTGDSHTVKVGLSIPFGDSTTAVDALNPLATSTLPYRAASWAGTLD